MATPAGAQWVGNNDIGLGAHVVGWREPYYASAGIVDASANRNYPDFTSLEDDAWLYLAELGLDHDLGRPEEASLRLTASHMDRTGDGPQEGPGQSLMLSGSKQLDAEWALFSRWSKSFERLSGDYRELLSVGVASIQPFGYSRDFVALGGWIGDPSDDARGTEYGAELGYRFQLTQGLRLTPDLQYWHRDDDDGTRARTWVLGLRLTLEY